jgi:hypothetical protein
MPSYLCRVCRLTELAKAFWWAKAFDPDVAARGGGGMFKLPHHKAKLIDLDDPLGGFVTPGSLTRITAEVRTLLRSAANVREREPSDPQVVSCE